MIYQNLIVRLSTVDQTIRHDITADCYWELLEDEGLDPSPVRFASVVGAPRLSGQIYHDVKYTSRGWALVRENLTWAMIPAPLMTSLTCRHPLSFRLHRLVCPYPPSLSLACVSVSPPTPP